MTAIALRGVLLWCLVYGATPAWAEERTFPAGSLIIPVDPCWQPVQAQPVGHGCAGGGTYAAAAVAHGLAYRLQRAGIPVYLAAGSGATEIAFVLRGDGLPPAVELPGGVELAPPARTAAEGTLEQGVLDYRGAPFLIDRRDLDATAQQLLAASPEVRRHQAQLPFAAPVARLLTGLPERLVAADDASAALLSQSLATAGLTGADGVAVMRGDSSAAGSLPITCFAEPPAVTPPTGVCDLPAIFTALYAAAPATAPQEMVSVAPVVADGRLYVAGSVFPGRSGHLRAFSLKGSDRVELWDAADGIPLPGDAPLPILPEDLLAPDLPGSGSERVLFTNAGAGQGYRLMRLDASAAAALAPQLGSVSVTAAIAEINAVRGRLDTSVEAPLGRGDQGNRLGAISRSTPALVGPSPYIEAARARDRVLYVGSETGLLHALLAGSQAEPAGNGRELWGYLPSTLLPVLHRQARLHAAAFSVARVDGSPAVADQFADFDGDGRREWRTVLVATASAEGLGGVAFALDVTDPYQPAVLWEQPLGAIGLGSCRGVAMSFAGSSGGSAPAIFLTAAPMHRCAEDGAVDRVNGRFGVMACALDLVDGSLRWMFFSAYAQAAANLNAPPAPPALMTSDGRVRWVVFGDLAGRLWALDAVTGKPLNGSQIYRLPGGNAMPIVAGVAVRGDVVYFGSGGADHVDPATPQLLGAVEVKPSSLRLLWTLPLAAGEQLWGAPLLDRSGRLYATVGNPVDQTACLLAVNAEGVVSGAAPLAGLPGESLALGGGVVVSVSRQGTIDQIGNWREPAAAEQRDSKVRILSWRFR